MDSDFEDLFEDNDEEIVNYIQRSYTVRMRPDNLNNWSDIEFYQRFRLTKSTVQTILQEIYHVLEHKTDRNYAVPPMLQLLIALRFYATGDMYIVVGDFGGIHKTTAGKIVQKVTNAINGLREQYIYMPRNVNEIQLTQQKFYNISRFPRSLGAVDGTHIRMVSPGGCEAENFRNRKGYFSLNVQAICNADNLITDIVARWPGSAHDSTIFDHSAIRAKFEAGLFNNSLLLGDSGYPLRSYLMTPIRDPQSNAEELYNESHIRTRTIIERTFGIWKRRFPVLSIGMRCKIPLTQDIIVAVAILHNIATTQNNPLPEEDTEIEVEPDQIVIQNNNANNRNNAQLELIDYFNSLL